MRLQLLPRKDVVDIDTFEDLEIAEEKLRFRKKNTILKEPLINQISDYNQLLLRCLSHENFASREPIFEKYDKQVQGRSIMESGQNDAGILAPFNSDDYPEEIQDIEEALKKELLESFQ